MRSHGRLFELLEEWRALTVSESEAIRALDWPKLERCQTAKERLMSHISANEEMTSCRIQERVREIVALERQNERDLLAARAKLEDERILINRTTRTVRQLSQAYGGQSGTNWHSYS